MIRILSVALILALSSLSGLSRHSQTAKPSGDLKRYSPEGCGLSLDLPGQALPANIPLPKDSSQQFRYLKYYMYKGDHFLVFIAHCSSFESFKAKPFAEGVIKGLIQSSDISDLQYSTEPSTPDKAPLKGAFKQKGVMLEMKGVTIVQETHTWCVVGVYMQSDETVSHLVERIVDSIKVDGPTCPEQLERGVVSTSRGFQTST